MKTLKIMLIIAVLVCFIPACDSKSVKVMSSEFELRALDRCFELMSTSTNVDSSNNQLINNVKLAKISYSDM
ncbi:hypothetical protein [Glaciecola sp. KUL10]|uniref:hypothetical protein n=1 Tax=Glaciecola sp. (strain KUL10) TaxID=2161813 RepID=UPI000D787D9B|nr:hypothetical protein [Glaciecola sp. KUL10]GBL06323.1 hypothetical protein KUL10_36630 [Glaciecola sp. KUL10]